MPSNPEFDKRSKSAGREMTPDEVRAFKVTIRRCAHCDKGELLQRNVVDFAHAAVGGEAMVLLALLVCANCGTLFLNPDASGQP